MQTQPAGETQGFDTHYLNKLMLLFVGLMFISFYIEGMLTPSLPAIASEFNINIAQVSLVIALYAMTGTALAPVIGKLGDIYGKKRILTCVLLMYAVAVSVTGFSPNFTFMLVARTVQGIGIAIIPLIFSLVREEFPKDRIPKTVGILSGVNGVGLAVALPLGSFISNDFGWRMTYHTSIPFVILLAVATFLLVKESTYRRPNVKIDYIGAILLGLSLATAVLALAEGPTLGWTSITTILLGITGLGLLLPLLLYERRYLGRGGEPILNLKLLAMRNVLVTNIAILGLLGLTLAGQVFVFKLELPSPVGYGLDIFETGLSLIPLALAMFIFSPLTGLIVSKIGVKPLGFLGSMVAALGFYLCAQASSYSELLVFIFVVGTGLGIMISAVQNLILLTVNPKEMGLATGLNTVFRNLGNSIGAPIAGSVLSTFTVSLLVGHSNSGASIHRSFPSAAAFQYSFYIAAVAFLAIAVVILFAREVLGKKAETKTAPT